MLKEILAVSGKPGLYRLISKASNLSIIESLTDKKRIPAYARDKIVSIENVSIFTEEGEAPINEVFTSIKEKENGEKVSMDYLKADADGLRTYMAEVLPNFDRERVYPTDIKKLLKWYDELIANGITDFSKKDEAEEGTDEVKEEKRKDLSPASVKPAKMTATKPMPKNTTPKKSVVGAKRGG